MPSHLSELYGVNVTMKCMQVSHSNLIGGCTVRFLAFPAVKQDNWETPRQFVDDVYGAMLMH